MATFSTNQNHQLLVATNYKEVADAKAAKTFADGATAGTITVRQVDSACPTIYFLYKGADTSLKSDYIPVRSIDYIKVKTAKELRIPFKQQKVILNPTINEGKPVVGQDYILRIELTHWIGMSDNDTYFKEAAVHVFSDMEAADFYTAMVKSLNLSFSREIGATKDSNPYLDFKASADGITITEKAQSWALGIESQEPVLFNAVPTTIYVNGSDVIWGGVADSTPKVSAVDPATGNGIGNGHKIADLEWFCMGERGDQYRYMGYPNYIPTKYLVDPEKEYHVLDIHYAFTDEGTHSYRSEKDLSIVSADAATMNSLITKLATATGIDAAKIVTGGTIATK